MFTMFMMTEKGASSTVSPPFFFFLLPSVRGLSQKNKKKLLCVSFFSQQICRFYVCKKGHEMTRKKDSPKSLNYARNMVLSRAAKFYCALNSTTSYSVELDFSKLLSCAAAVSSSALLQRASEFRDKLQRRVARHQR